jgi:hypothetical protein
MNIRYYLEEWRVVIGCSTHNLKAALLRKVNVFASISVDCTVHKKEAYGNTKDILSCMSYKTYKWHICGDLKVIAILM